MHGLQRKDIPRYVAGLLAGILALFYLTAKRTDASVVIPSVYFIIACAIDTIKAKIPNTLNASLAIAGLALFFYAEGWTGLLNGLLGLTLGIALLLVPWLMGGMGAGDVKALGALGALLGPYQLIHVFVYMGLIGGAMSVLHYLFARNLKGKLTEWLTSFKATVLLNDPNLIIPDRTETLRFPYAAAIAFGYYAYLCFGKVL